MFRGLVGLGHGRLRGCVMGLEKWLKLGSIGHSPRQSIDDKLMKLRENFALKLATFDLYCVNGLADISISPTPITLSKSESICVLEAKLNDQ